MAKLNAFQAYLRWFSSMLIDAQKEEWFCTTCNVRYYPNKGEKVKRANKFETLGPLTDAHRNITGEKTPIVSIINDTPEKKDTIHKHFREMKDTD
jgi:hypothetical protein